MLLQGKTALITGSSRGIGQTIALALAAEGAFPGINYLDDPEGKNRAQAEETVRKLAADGVKTAMFQADVSNDRDVDAMVSAFLETFGTIDILVNNAGIVQDTTLKKMSRQNWDDVLATNLTGVFVCTKAVINHMREAGSGRIINISSIIAQTGNIGQSNYAAAKAGILGFTKSVAREVARRGITVNAIAPGFIRTDMLNTIPDAIKTRLTEEIPLGRFGLPEDIACAAVFLASDMASYITGQVLHVNGGLYM
ncbi:MAG: 3-oxoacyl-[acyl-carrier-protein] reductase [Candidatus Ratteibacteria bacterium]|jgi:3-oxoacyl-[acyl-carrier protein] reductase